MQLINSIGLGGLGQSLGGNKIEGQDKKKEEKAQGIDFSKVTGGATSGGGASGGGSQKGGGGMLGNLTGQVGDTAGGAASGVGGAVGGITGGLGLGGQGGDQ